MSPHIKDKIIRGVIIVVGIVVFAVGMLLLTRDVTRVANWSRSGFVLCSVDGDDKGIRFFNVDKDDFVAPPYPVRGDTILTIADSAATFNCWINVLEVAHAPGRIVDITFRHEGQEFKSQIKTRPVAPSLRVSVCALQVLKAFIFLSFLGLGFWTFIKRPNSPAVRVLALYSFSMATFMTRTFMPMFAQMAAFRIPYEGFFLATMGITGFFFSGFWLLLQMYFPRPASLVERRPWLVYSFTIFPLLFIFILNVTLGIVRYPGVANLRFVVYAAAAIQIV
ncbi:hypothetical protein EHM69_10085, partial [candidate division KSB1 bacterium]